MRFASVPTRLLAAVALGIFAVSLAGGRAHAANDAAPAPSLASDNQTSFLTAIKDSAVASDGADYTAILNQNGLFVSVVAGSVSFSLPGSQSVVVAEGDVIVITGDAGRGTYIDVLNGSAMISDGVDEDGNPAFVSVSTSIGIAFAPASADVTIPADETATAEATAG
jgi:hypothetical protein